jgi:tape measure domain-containing protein
MKFDNKDFQSGIDTTLKSLGTLGKTLDAGFTSKAVGGLSKLGGMIKGFSFGSMSSGVQGVSAKFLALGTIAVTALSKITSSAISAGTAFVKQFSGWEGMKAGFQEYETQMGSIQTILANTGLDQKKGGLKTVNAALLQLNKYSDKTIYNFSEMARNIGTFTAAGVDLKTSVTSIKGIANIAALSGSNAQQASTAMYQLSQAIASGKVGLQDWNSVVNAGMGGKIFQQSLIRTAEAMGAIKESAVSVDKATGQMKINGQSFRESIMAAPGKQSWLTSGVLTNTLSQFSGDLSDAQLAAQGFTKAQIVDIQQQAKAAQDAATKVKTFTQLIGTLKEAIGSGWAQTFGIVIGNFNEAKSLFTGMSSFLGGFITRSAKARNKMLTDWKKAGGRTDLLAGFKNLFRVFEKIIRPIHNAFRDIFPRSTGEQLAKITEGFRKLTEGLLFGKKYSVAIKNIFKGIFTVFKILGIVIGAAVKYIAEFFGIIVSGGGGSAVLSLAGAVGKLVAWIGKWLIEGDRLKKFFDALINARNQILEPLVGTIGAVVEAFVALFSGDATGFFNKLGDAGGHIVDLFDIIHDRIEAVSATASGFFDTLGAGGLTIFQNAVQGVSDAIDIVKDKLTGGSDAVSGGAGSLFDSAPVEKTESILKKFSFILDIVKASWDLVVNTLTGVGNIVGPVTTGLGKVLTSVLGALSRFFDNLDFNQVLALLQTGIFYKIAKTMSSVTEEFASFIQLKNKVGAVLDEVKNSLKTMQTAIKVHMIKDIAEAVGILAISVIGLSLIPKGKLVGAMTAMSTILAEVMATMIGLGKLNFASIALVGPTMIAIAIAVGILGTSLLVFQLVKWDAMAKAGVALAGIGAVLLVLGNASPQIWAAAKSIAIVAPALLILATALTAFMLVKWSSLAKAGTALVGLGVVLGVLGTFAPDAILASAAFLVFAPALLGMSVALAAFALVKWSSVGKALVIVGGLAVILGTLGALGPLAVAGSAAILIVVGALNLLLPVLITLATMDFSTILKAVASVALILVTLGTISAAFGVVSPLIAAFGLAMGIVSLALLAAGAGTFLFATGLTLIAAAGTAAFAVLITGITSFLLILPQWVMQFGQTIRAFAQVVKQEGPLVIKAFGTLLGKLLNEIIKHQPQFRHLMVTLINNGLAAIRATFPNFVKTGFQLIMNMLAGLDKNMNAMTDKGADVIVKFLKGIQRNDDKVVHQGIETLKSLGKAMAREIVHQADVLYEKAKGIGSDIIAGIVHAVASGGSSVANAIGDVASSAISAAKDKLHIPGAPSRVFMDIGDQMVAGGVIGVDRSAPKLHRSVENMGRGAIGKMQSIMSTMANTLALDDNFQPTVTPVLDLSEVKKHAGQISNLVDTTSVSASLVGAQALATQLSGQNSQNGSENTPIAKHEVSFTQNNYSPVSLPEGRIYRASKNLLNMERRRLGIE